MDIKVGDTLVIHCYKHNGMIYKSWDLAYVLDIKDDLLVLGNENVLVTKQDGRTWRTKEPAIMFFYTKRWFNIIAQLKNNGIFYFLLLLRYILIILFRYNFKYNIIKSNILLKIKKV